MQPAPLQKAPTGIAGLDALTRGGLPRGRTTLVAGGAGCGKTVLALQILVNGARNLKEPGIFVAFEESAQRIIANAESFGWDIPQLEKEHLFFLDAQPDSSMIQSGNVDMGGMLAALEAKIAKMGAKRIAFDAIDIVLSLFGGDALAMRREIYRLHDWLLARNLTAVITQKVAPDDSHTSLPSLDFLQFMVDCVLELELDMVQRTSQRSLRVSKFRGSSFSENQVPITIGDEGIEVAYFDSGDRKPMPVSDERISTGITRLDKMLDGGYFRGASVLITGSPGTAKTTLCGAFIESACGRGEPALLCSYDSHEGEVMRNLSSVGIELLRYVERGLLQFVSARALNGNAEVQVIEIKRKAKKHGARCLVIDPISALSKGGNVGYTLSVVERLVNWAKDEGITLVCTSLLDSHAPDVEGTPLDISTIADTWIHLKYNLRGGERNRALSVIKSRGTAHSNQERELILSDKGVTLEDVYMAGGEVLMGTLRFEKEQENLLLRQAAEVERSRRKHELENAISNAEFKIKELTRQLESLRREREIHEEGGASRVESLKRARAQRHELRKGDIDSDL